MVSVAADPHTYSTS